MHDRLPNSHWLMRGLRVFPILSPIIHPLILAMFNTQPISSFSAASLLGLSPKAASLA